MYTTNGAICAWCSAPRWASPFRIRFVMPCWRTSADTSRATRTRSGSGTMPDLGRTQGTDEQPRRRGDDYLADPRLPPQIDFRYFDEGTDAQATTCRVL